jgi:hypothetical protein
VPEKSEEVVVTIAFSIYKAKGSSTAANISEVIAGDKHVD